MKKIILPAKHTKHTKKRDEFKIYFRVFRARKNIDQVEHLSKENLAKYAERKMSADEMTAAILHLENCAECFNMLQTQMFAAQKDGVLLFSEAEPKPFHLDYDDHLKPFVDNLADNPTREIVESHTQICSECAFQLRELREFAESLRFRELEKKSAAGVFGKINDWIYQISHNLTLKIVFPLLFIVIGIVAVVWFWESAKPKSSEKADIENQSENENRILQTAANSNENNQIVAESGNQNRNPKIENTNDLANIKANKINENISSEKDFFAEINNLPNDLQSAVRKTLQTEKLAFPAFLAAIRENINLRGSADKNLMPIYPTGEAVRDQTPQFRWNRFAVQDEKYVVEIFDEKNNSLEISPTLNETNWKPKTVLERGKTYHWEVRIERTNAQTSKFFAGKFKVLEQSELDNLSKISSKSAIVRGIIFASAGLLSEAETEFKNAIKNSENPNLANKLLRQITNQK